MAGACLQALFWAGAAPAAEAGAAAEPGAWQAHKLDFQYMGFTSTYSCDGLGDTLQLLLKTSGAGKGAKVSPLCALGSGRPDKLASATLKFDSLQPLAGGATAAASGPVAGEWRHVEIAWRNPHALERGDCELVEQFADKVLPLFATRNVDRQITCIPHQDSGSRYSLKFDVFAALEAPKSAASMAAGK
jgi:hypothetical protein